LHKVLSNPFTLKIGAFAALSERELDAVGRLQSVHRICTPGQDLVEQGQQGRVAYILLSGWTISYKTQVNGSRQIAGIQVPGDFVGFRSILLSASDHSVKPVVDSRVAEVTVDALQEAFAGAPRLAMAILWAASRDSAMVVEHLVGLGRRNALERMAHLLLELGVRLALVGAAGPTGYSCPLTQDHLADTLGLSVVHVNRVLRRLREDGMVTFRDGYVTFDDRERLMTFARFDPAYLDQTGPPRV